MPGAVGFSNRAVSTAHGAACAVGAILGRLAAGAAAAPATSDDNPPGARTWTTLSEDAIPVALSSVTAAIAHPVSLLHVAACGAVGRVGAASALPLADAVDGAPAPEPSMGNGEDKVTTVAAVFERLWAACKLGETTDASRRAEAAAEALGRCCRGALVRVATNGATTEKDVQYADSTRVRKTLRVLFDMAKNQVCVCTRRGNRKSRISPTRAGTFAREPVENRKSTKHFIIT